MGKFGLKKGDDEDSNRKALFGSKAKNKNKGPPENPYAQAQPLRSDPYTRAKINAGVAPAPAGLDPNADMGRPGIPNAAGAPAGPTVSGPARGYAPDKYGNQGGYGSARFGGDAPSRYGAGGYGGLGGDPNEADSNRAALFGGSRERMKQQDNANAGPPPEYSEANEQPNYENSFTPEIYGDRQLTAEEEEEEEIKAVKQDLKFIKQGDVSSSRNALRAAAQAEEVGQNTLARLGAQGERIHNTEKNLDISNIEARVAEEKAKELRSITKSMFAVHMNNPFTSASRRRERDLAILNTNRDDRSNREATRLEAYRAGQRMDRNFRDMETMPPSERKKKNLLDRKKYQFEADSEDDAMEDEIDQNLNLLGGAAGRLNGVARATNKELDEQNRHLERIMGKVSGLTCLCKFLCFFTNAYFKERHGRRSDCCQSCQVGSHSLSRARNIIRYISSIHFRACWFHFMYMFFSQGV